MNYEDFKQAFLAEMFLKAGGPGVEIYEHQVDKPNETWDAISVRPAGSSIASQIYYKDYYEEYKEGTPIPLLADSAVRNMELSRAQMPEVPEISHSFIEENLYLTVLNYDMNRSWLSSVPHERLEDMAVVPRVRVSEEASFAVKNPMLAGYGFSKKDLFKAAHANMDKQEYRCMSLSGMLMGFGLEPVTEMDPASNVYVLTNMSSVDGAAAITSEKAMKQARETIGEDFFILPSSRHEVILVPRSMSFSVADLKDMVVSANRTVVEDKDLLSDNVYRYNSSKGTIKMLEPKEEAKKLDRALPPVL